MENIEIIKIKPEIRNVEKKMSYNKVLVKADCQINCLYMTEAGSVYITKKEVPMMGFLDIENVEDLFRLFVNTGNIINTINYDEIYKYFYDAMTINGKGYNLPASLFGLLVSELCRDPDDINKPFRLGTAIDKDRYSYKPVSIKEVPKLVSPFTSLTSENFDKAVVGAIMNKNNGHSPLERVLIG